MERDFHNDTGTKDSVEQARVIVPGLDLLWEKTVGDPSICIAVLDGPVDQSHPCFDGAHFTSVETLVSGVAGPGPASQHGTHITSVIFGQHGGPVYGIAPGCRGLIVPVFRDEPGGELAPCSQIDLARAIIQAMERGAHVINISGGEPAASTEPHSLLANAVRLCAANGVLIVAAAGNEGCQCLHVPAATSPTLAVGAMDAQGWPLDFSNWGEAYQTQGILAPGEHIVGAVPGGGVTTRSGTSFATPIVSGIVALLLSIQRQRGAPPNPYAVREALLGSASPCPHHEAIDCRRFLVGRLNIVAAHALLTKGGTSEPVTQRTDRTHVQPRIVASVEPTAFNTQAQAVGKQTPVLISLEETMPLPAVSPAMCQMVSAVPLVPTLFIQERKAMLDHNEGDNVQLQEVARGDLAAELPQPIIPAVEAAEYTSPGHAGLVPLSKPSPMPAAPVWHSPALVMPSYVYPA